MSSYTPYRIAIVISMMGWTSQGFAPVKYLNNNVIMAMKCKFFGIEIVPYVIVTIVELSRFSWKY